MPKEIRKKNPEFSFSVLKMQFCDIESVFAAPLQIKWTQFDMNSRWQEVFVDDRKFLYFYDVMNSSFMFYHLNRF